MFSCHCLQICFLCFVTRHTLSHLINKNRCLVVTSTTAYLLGSFSTRYLFTCLPKVCETVEVTNCPCLSYRFFNGPTQASFFLIFALFKHKFYWKNFRRQRDLNSDRRNRTLTTWPPPRSNVIDVSTSLLFMLKVMESWLLRATYSLFFVFYAINRKS